MGSESDAVLVNLLLGGQLRERLVEWRCGRGRRLSHQQIADVINAELREIAERVGAEPPRPRTQPTIRRWCTEVYEVE